MRPILLAALLALPLPLAAQTVGGVLGPPTTQGLMNGTKLQALCATGTADKAVASTFVCAGYITGAIDSFAAAQAVAGLECLTKMPRDISPAALIEIVKDHMRRRTDEELAERRASIVVWDAVDIAWPCPKKP